MDPDLCLCLSLIELHFDQRTIEIDDLSIVIFIIEFLHADVLIDTKQFLMDGIMEKDLFEVLS